MIPIFWKGSQRDLVLSDLYVPLKDDESEFLGDKLERSVIKFRIKRKYVEIKLKIK